jgi:two-component system sensor histidine kinase ResE
VNITVLQVVLTLLIIVGFWVAARHQQWQTIEAIGRYTPVVMSEGLTEDLKDVRLTTLGYLLTSLIPVTIFFGYLASRYALRPARTSLQFQKKFIGNMAHEIRTPLAIIKTNTEVALMDSHLSPSMRDTLTTTSEELDRISETINNLLSFESMVRPSRVNYAEVDLEKLAHMVVKRHEALAESRGIALALETNGSAPVLGNMTGVDQVLTNLVKNALNYTPRHENGEVRVKVSGDDDAVVVSISDTGIGIAKKDLYYIFQPFYRADTSRSRGVSGGTSGLGLAIVNEIVRSHQGKISVRSALNRGTTFEVCFPRVKSDETKVEAEESDDGEEAEVEIT